MKCLQMRFSSRSTTAAISCIGQRDKCQSMLDPEGHSSAAENGNADILASSPATSID